MTDDAMLLVALLGGGAVLLAVAGLLLMLRGAAARGLEQRVLTAASAPLQTGVLPGNIPLTPLGWLRHPLLWVGELVRGRFYTERELITLEAMIAGSGLRPQTVLPLLLGTKMVLAVGVPAAVAVYAHLAGFTGSRQLTMALIAVPVGLLGPDWVVALLRRPYLAALRRGVPDALDLLVVCSEAGMGLESALEHVTAEIRHSNPAVSMALGKLLDEIRVLPDRRIAFRNFADRTGVEGARRVATMLAQSMQYGTPLSQALRTVAIDLRRERMIALEAKASRLPVLLVLPLIIFIMPSLFIVLVGPAMLGLMDTMHTMVSR